MRLFRKIIFLPTFLIVLLCFSTLAYGVLLNSDNAKDKSANPLTARNVSIDSQNNQVTAISKEPEHTPNEVIIKLKHRDSPKILYSMSYSQRSSMDTAILTNLKTKYRLTDERPVFKRLHDQLKSANISQMQMDEKNSVKSLNKAQLNSVPKQASQTVDLLPIYVLSTDENPQEVSNKLKQDSDIEYAEPNYIRKVQIVPNDPYYSSRGSWGQSYDDLWGMKRIRCDLAWDESQGEGVVVAVIDTGADYNHPDLWDNVWINPAIVPDRNHDGKVDLNDCDLNGDHIIEPNEIVDNMFGWNFVSYNNNPMDDHGHGTHTSGTIAATGNNGMGVIGVSPRAKIMILKGLDQDGNGYDWTLAQCITYAADNGAKVLSNSWGGPGRSGLLADAFHYAYSKGCIAVAAAGNSGTDASDFIPANIDTIIAVAAIDPYDGLASFSNYGMNVCVSAPGVDILSLRANGTDMYKDGVHIVGEEYYRSNGTSMACPHVAGLAALIASRYPQYNNDQIRWLIKNSVDDVTSIPEPMFPPGFGVINTPNSLLNPNIPPRLHVTIDVGQIDYNLNNISISYDVEGEDLWQYTIQYKKAEEPDWDNLVGPSNTPGQSQYTWDLNNVSDGSYLILLSAMTNDGRQETIYASVSIDRRSFYTIFPETIFAVIGRIDTHVGETAQGLYRLGAKVPLVGRPFGEYHLEWRKAVGGATWSSDYFDYEVGNGYLGIWDTSSITEDGVYYVRLVDNLGVERYTQIKLDSKLKEGFPITLSPFNALGQIDSSGLGSRMADIDNDGKLEIVTLRAYFDPAQIYIINADGTLKKSWEIKGQYGNSAYPALADIDGDGIDEILVTTSAQTVPGSGIYQETLYCFKVDGTLVSSRSFPPSTDSYRAVYMRDPVIVADLNNDSIPEIIYRHDSAIYVLDNHGNDFSPAWPKLMEAGYPMSIGDTDYMAVGNFDDDKDLELVIVQNEGYVEGGQTGHINIHVFNLDGTEAPGWPRTIENAYSMNNLSCGDMDGYGYDDIVLITGYKGSQGYYGDQTIYGFRYNGTPLFVAYAPDYYRSFFSSLVADLNNDNKCEVIFDNQGKIEVVDGNGQSFGKWPYSHPYPYPILAIDIDGDNEIETICARSEAGNMYLTILSANGEEKISNPFNGMIIPTAKGLYYCDIDGDGYGELVIEGCLPVWHEGTHLYWGYRPCILVYKTDMSSNPNLAQWPTPHHDKNNTNRWSNIKEPNHKPLLDPIGDKAIDEGKLLEFGINATDPDGDKLTYSVTSLPRDAIFNPDTKTFSWIPTSDQAGTYQVTFTVSDGLLTASESITITINNVNRAPVIISVPDQTVKEGESFSLQLNAKDPDGDSLIYSFNRWDDSLRGLTLSPSGLITWKPDYGQAGEYALELIVSDMPNHPSDYIKTYFPVKIKVLHVNRAPILNPIGNKTVNRLKVLSLTIKAIDPDGDQVTYDIYNIPKGAQLNKKTGKFMWRPNIYQAGDFKVTFIAKDTIGALSQGTITITVPNKAPILDPISNKIVAAGQLLFIRITAKDPDKIDNFMLSYYAENLPKGVYLYSNGIFIWKPTKYQRGAYTVKFYVKDPPGLTNGKIVTITVR